MPPLTHAFVGDSKTPTGKSPVEALFLSPESWCTRFCCALQESCVHPSLVSNYTLILSATPALNYFYKIPSSSPGLGHIVFKGRSPLYPPLTGKAIKLLFSTSPQTLSLRLELAPVKRGRDFSISCDCDSVKLIFLPF